MLKHDGLPPFERRSKMDSVNIIDLPTGQFCDGLTREGSASQESLDGRDRYQFDWLGTRRGHAGVDRKVGLSRHLGHWGGCECSKRGLL
jgi:hypothetical protein